MPGLVGVVAVTAGEEVAAQFFGAVVPDRLRLPLRDEPPDEHVEGFEHGGVEQVGLRAEVAEQERLRYAGGVADLAGARAAVPPFGEGLPGGVEEEAVDLFGGAPRLGWQAVAVRPRLARRPLSVASGGTGHHATLPT